MEGWDIPPEIRRDVVNDLYAIMHKGESERERVRAAEALMALGIDKPHDNIEREQAQEHLEIERDKLTAAPRGDDLESIRDELTRLDKELGEAGPGPPAQELPQ